MLITSKFKGHGGVMTFWVVLLNLFGWAIIFLVLNPIISGSLFDNYSLMVDSGLGQFIALVVGTLYQLGYVYWTFKHLD